MKFLLKYIKDTIGNNYLGVDIPKDVTYPFLEKLKEYLGEDEFDVYHRGQQERDRGHNHITVVNVMECNTLIRERGMDWFTSQVNNLFSIELNDIKFMGIGKATRNENTSYFIVVNSNILNEVRKSLGLAEHDFHVTIGFKWKDVFGVRKNEVMKFEEPFLNKLRTEYVNNRETFDFIKEIENYFGEEDDDIECISINSSRAKFRIEGTNKYFSVSYLNPQGLYITSIWEDDEEIPNMSSHLIVKRLLNN